MPVIYGKSPQWIYFVRMDAPDKRPVTKVGISFDLENRLNGLNGGNPYDLELIAAFKFKRGEEAGIMERAVLKHFETARAKGSEWLFADVRYVLKVFAHKRRLFGLSAPIEFCGCGIGMPTKDIPQVKSRSESPNLDMFHGSLSPANASALMAEMIANRWYGVA